MTVTLSICIPTYNRSKYLNNLLEDIHKELSIFPYQYELIISNNASTDETSAVVEAWLEKLPITYINQSENIGSVANVESAFSHASGIFSMYLADDDFINVVGLKEAISKIISQPNVVALYAPWSLINFQEKNNDLLFYNIPEDVLFAKNSHAHLLDFVLKHHIFPEISIFRTEAYKRTPPVTGDIAFWAFTNITHWLAIGDVFFQKQPFYYFSTTYFRDAPRDRTQEGNEQVEYAWDQYRGGLEYLLGRSMPTIDKRTFEIFLLRINEFIAIRMSVALRLRIANKRNPIEIYQLAARLCGIGRSDLLPISYNEIKSSAALWYLGNDRDLTRGKSIILMVGGFDERIVAHVRHLTNLDVLAENTFSGRHSKAIHLLKAGLKLNQDELIKIRLQGSIVVNELDLMQSFF